MSTPGDGLNFKSAARSIVISVSISLAVMICDLAWLIRDEVKYIWPRLRVSWYARVYILARYIGLASQIFNICFTVRMYLGIPTTKAGCRVWFSYQALVVQFLLACVEGTLMHRIYALFLRSQYILWTLVMFGAGQVASLAVSARFSFPSVPHTDTCMIVRSNAGNVYFGITTMTTNMIIFFLTFWKYLRLPVTWTRQGVGRVVIRDSALSLFAISIVMLFLTLCSLEVIRPAMSGNITYYWLVCILWVSIGRIIVNHEKLSYEEDETPLKSGLQLTSRIEIGETCSQSEESASEVTDVSSPQSAWSDTIEVATSASSTEARDKDSDSDLSTSVSS